MAQIKIGHIKIKGIEINRDTLQHNVLTRVTFEYRLISLYANYYKNVNFIVF